MRDVAKELASLPRMTPAQLRAKYVEVFGEETVTKNRTWLVQAAAVTLMSEG
jgi:hypothetical protein